MFGGPPGWYMLWEGGDEIQENTTDVKWFIIYEAATKYYDESNKVIVKLADVSYLEVIVDPTPEQIEEHKKKQEEIEKKK